MSDRLWTRRCSEALADSRSRHKVTARLGTRFLAISTNGSLSPFRCWRITKDSSALCTERTVIRKCANPDCDIEFRSSHEGRLFVFEIKNPTEPCRDVPAVICEKKPGHATVYFWLCERCCGQFTLQFTVSAGLRLTPVCSEQDADRKTNVRSNAAIEPESYRRRFA